MLKTSIKIFFIILNTLFVLAFTYTMYILIYPHYVKLFYFALILYLLILYRLIRLTLAFDAILISSKRKHGIFILANMINILIIVYIFSEITHLFSNTYNYYFRVSLALLVGSLCYYLEVIRTIIELNKSNNKKSLSD